MKDRIQTEITSPEYFARICAMARKLWQSIPFKPVMVLAAFLYGALCL